MSLQYCVLIFAISFFQIASSHRMPKYEVTDLLDPVKLRPFMFQTEISGLLNVLIPTNQTKDDKNSVIMDHYLIEMIKTKKQILPRDYGQTTLYVYAGQTKNGYQATFPGPAILATKDVPIKVTWRNNITGPHMLPVDFNYPFKSSEAFVKQVPVVPHVHGVATNSSSDGQPEAYWTKSGLKSSSYQTMDPCSPNEAVFFYPNEQQASNNWYHDHTIGITRLNVYAGLAGFYKILDPNNKKQARIVRRNGFKLSQNETKYLIISDKSFKTSGELFYPNTSSPGFSSWVPEFYGNVMLVNGEIWPKITLKKGKHRFVILNACQNRLLNIYFQNYGKKIPIELVRVDGDYYQNQIVVTEIFATISSRMEFILDFSYVQGEVVMKNNAAAPYPDGDPANLVPEFTGQLLKFIIRTDSFLNQQLVTEKKLPIPNLIKIHDIEQNTFGPIKQILTYSDKKTQNYPVFPEGQKVFTTLIEVDDRDQNVIAMFIDGISMVNGMNCPNSTFQIGKTYDFHIINLTPDTHPLHFHLINLQKVKQYQFDVTAYALKYYEINGGLPDRHGFSKPATAPDPETFRSGDDELPRQYQKVFRDTVDAHPGYVTVIRIKFAKNDGTLFKSFNMKGQRYVWHCHMLEHQDNEMMKYFCLK